MTDINRVFLVGRLTRDAELKFTNSGTPVTRFSVAVNRSRKNGDKWEDEVSYIDVVLWGKMGESLNRFLQKGKQVALDGELRQSRWEQDGQTRSRLEVVAGNVQLLGGNGGSGNGNFSEPFQGGYERKQADNMRDDGPDHFNDDGIPF